MWKYIPIVRINLILLWSTQCTLLHFTIVLESDFPKFDNNVNNINSNQNQYYSKWRYSKSLSKSNKYKCNVIVVHNKITFSNPNCIDFFSIAWIKIKKLNTSLHVNRNYKPKYCGMWKSNQNYTIGTIKSVIKIKTRMFIIFFFTETNFLL